jgi:hypothetical protein
VRQLQFRLPELAKSGIDERIESPHSQKGELRFKERLTLSTAIAKIGDGGSPNGRRCHFRTRRRPRATGINRLAKHRVPLFLKDNGLGRTVWGNISG